MEQPQDTQPTLHSEVQQTVSTHVLVDAQQLERLRALARKTRVSQNDYLREAVQDLLTKYQSQSDTGVRK